MSGADDAHVVSIEIEAPVERVWEEITKTGRLQPAMYNTVLESDLEPGSKLRYYSLDHKRVFIVGEVVEVVPLRKFAHTFLMVQNDETPTLVVWELEARDQGCRVTITHSGFTAEHKKPEKTIAGWREILGLLKAQVETGKLPLKTRLLYALMGKLMFLLPKSTKTEEVERAGW